MMRHLMVKLEAPLQAWGTVSIDAVRVTGQWPTLSGLTGLFASALGYTYKDGERTNALQSALQFATLEIRVGGGAPSILQDFQSVDLGAMPSAGWTRWGMEKRGGAFSKGTHLLEKQYLENAAFRVAVKLHAPHPVSLDQLAEALRTPSRPLYLGRRSCIPSARLLDGWQEANTGFDALMAFNSGRGDNPPNGGRCWYEPGDGPKVTPQQVLEVWDRRDFVNDVFGGSRMLCQYAVVGAKS